jgi:glucose-1-phosphate thymidylyltransferase
MKGIILHGGAGTRLRPLSFSGPKQLVPVANKPVSQWCLEDLVSCGITEISIVLGETFPELVREYYGDGSRFNANITYIYQGRPLGIAQAVGLCREFVSNESFVVYLGDNLLQKGIGKYLEKFSTEDFDAMVLLKEVDDPTRFGVAVFDENKKLIGLVEKPKKPPTNYALVGVYFFKPVVFDIIDELKPSWRGEYEITDAIHTMIKEGFNVGYEIVEGWWLDTGKKDDILQANALILDEQAVQQVEGDLLDSRLEGRVIVKGGAKIVKSTLRGPLIIGENCHIENSFIGPYTSIGNNCRIENSRIEFSVVLEGSFIENVERLDESLIGRYAKVIKNTGKSVKLHIGDYSEVEV